MMGITAPVAAVATWGGAIVGAVLVWAGVSKALAPHMSVSHLLRLRLVSGARVVAVVLVGVGAEVAWGVALITGAAPRVVLPATAVALVALAGLTWWSGSTGRAEDCGCYGGAAMVTPVQSIALDALYVLLVAAAWWVAPARPALPTTWGVGAAVVAGLATWGLARYAHRYPRTHGKLLHDPNPLRESRRWKAAWAAGAVRPDERGEVLVAYLGPTCPHCQRWVRMLNAVTQIPGLPRVVGVVSVPAEERDAFAAAHGIRFPVVRIPDALMERLANAVPTTALVEGGTVRRVWIGEMPAEFTERFVRAVFGVSVKSVNRVESVERAKSDALESTKSGAEEGAAV